MRIWSKRIGVIGLSELVAHGEVEQVLDLVDRYGTAPIGDNGFIVNYVRGYQRYEQAREMHYESGEDPDRAISDAAITNAYREAADLLGAALTQADADEFIAERATASLRIGLCSFYTGAYDTAAAQFEQTADLASRSDHPRVRDLAERALWFTLISLNAALDETSSPAARAQLEQRRNEVATLFLRTYPDSERAATLLIRQAADGLLAPEEAVQVLLGVTRDSPSYEAARREASKLLYRLYRGATRDEKSFAAMRFAGAAEEVLALDRAIALGDDEEAASRATSRVVIRARRLLDALLGVSSPDADRAERAMQILMDVANLNEVDLSEYEPELLFRRAQIALARDDDELADQLIEQLRTIGGVFAESADSVMYNRALDRWRRDQADVDWARLIVKYGSSLVGRFGSDTGALQRPQVVSLHLQVAGAAEAVWEQESDESMRDLALRLDEAVLAAFPRNETSLRRIARLSDAIGDPERALEAWRILLTAYAPDTDDWFEARYQTIRLLAETEPARARTVLQQFRLLHPSYGPEPWASQIRAVDERLNPNGPDGAGSGGGR